MPTLSHISQKGVFEKVIRARNGAFMRVRFEVYELDGALKGRVLSVEPILYISGGVASNSINCLPAVCSRAGYEAEYLSPYAPIVSPYIELYFFTSQPTRAPAFV